MDVENTCSGAAMCNPLAVGHCDQSYDLFFMQLDEQIDALRVEGVGVCNLLGRKEGRDFGIKHWQNSHNNSPVENRV